MTIRDRIVELRRVRADSLRPNPLNWRTHPPAQQAALRGVLDQIGYAGALLARELPDGSLELIDGHLRAETTPEAEVPVLVVDLNEREAALLLTVHDPLAAMAGTDAAQLAQLTASVEVSDAALRRMIGRLAASAGVATPHLGQGSDLAVLPRSNQVVVECADEEDQRHVFEELTERGYRCRVLSL